MAIKIVGLAGSLREHSINGALLRAAANVAPADCTVDVATIKGIPLYDGDVEAAGFPDAVVALKERVAQADGLLLATPEYNHSIPGVFKNAIDWLSRPASDQARVFKGKPVALMGASPGRMGTVNAQTAWLPVMRALALRPYFDMGMFVGGSGGLFSDGELTDEGTVDRLRLFMTAYASFVASTRQ